jgi:uncharacterized protein (TIGR02246 family)
MTTRTPREGANTTDRTADEEAIGDLFRRLLDDWGRGDGNAYGSRFTEDADYVAFDGSRTTGRRAIATSHQQLFDKYLEGTRLTGQVEGVRFLGPDVALVHATGGTVRRGKSRPSPERDSIQTLVAVRHGDEWRFATFHNCRVRPINSGVGFMIWALTDKLWRLFAPGKKDS